MIAAALSLLLQTEPKAVPTFECMGLEWNRPAGAADQPCRVDVRAPGGDWTPAWPLSWDPVEKQYRGSVVGLRSGTAYRFRLSHGADAVEVAASTWPDRFPLGPVTVLPKGVMREPLVLGVGGTASAWSVYRAHPEGTTIDVDGRADFGVVVRADFVILHGVVVRGAGIHGILVENRHDVVIEGCDVSGWGRRDPTDDPKKRADLGAQLDSGIHCEGKDVERVVIQGNRIHHPRWTSNDWSEWSPFFKSNHPQGPKAVVFKPQTKGRHVIRHNEVYSDEKHLFNDLLLESDPGWPGNGLCRDSDIQGNLLADGVDDGIEIERGTRNVRVWGNYFDRAGIKTLSVRPSWEGPYYVFRNVVDRSYVPKAPTSYQGRDIPVGMFIVGGGRGPRGAVAEPRERGVGYVFHNTLLCPEGAGFERFLVADFPQGLVEPERWFFSRNNVAATRPVRKVPNVPVNDFFTERVVLDHDLLTGIIDRPAAAGRGCVTGPARFRSGHGTGRSGLYQLQQGSPGHDAGAVLPGFNDGFRGKAPDLGAHEEDAPPLVFGTAGWIPAIGN
jgi:hypothetical protein